MIHYLVQGSVVSARFVGSQAAAERTANNNGMTLALPAAAIAGDATTDLKLLCCTSGVVDKKPAPTNPKHQWNSLAMQWADPRTLADAKAEKWAAMKEVRATKLTGTFTAGGKTYNCNREAIALAAIAAMLAKAALDLTWTKTWTLADNTSTTLTADQVLIVTRVCDDYINTLWATGRTLRAQINAATTIAAVDAINWPQG